MGELLTAPPNLDGLATAEEIDTLVDADATAAAQLAAYQASMIPEAVRVVGAAGQPAFQNNWSSFAGYGPVGFWKDPFGVVYLQGLTSSSVDPPAASVIFTLPVGYRPALPKTFPTFHSSLGNVFLTVQANGEVQCSTNIGVNVVIYLDGMNFRP